MTVEDNRPEPTRRSRLGTRMVLALLLLAFVGGAVLMAWLPRQRSGAIGPFGDFGGKTAGGAPNSVDPLLNGMVGGNESATRTTDAQAAALDVTAQTARIIELEQRLSRIAMAAQGASYNANRAEAIMTAFAVRRTLDNGRPLGYLEGTLRLRFGEAQPKAVATIINASAEPVTLPALRVGLDAIPVGARSQRDTGWWPGLWQELSGMAVIRRAGQPSPEPEQRLVRARRAIEMGQIDAAIAEVAALKPVPETQRWLEYARRYNEARRALDVIEAAAILEPRIIPLPTAPVAGATAPPAPNPPLQVSNAPSR